MNTTTLQKQKIMIFFSNVEIFTQRFIDGGTNGV
jgi:hypothetical protein